MRHVARGIALALFALVALAVLALLGVLLMALAYRLGALFGVELAFGHVHMGVVLLLIGFGVPLFHRLAQRWYLKR